MSDSVNDQKKIGVPADSGELLVVRSLMQDAVDFADLLAEQGYALRKHSDWLTQVVTRPECDEQRQILDALLSIQQDIDRILQRSEAPLSGLEICARYEREVRNDLAATIKAANITTFDQSGDLLAAERPIKYATCDALSAFFPDDDDPEVERQVRAAYSFVQSDRFRPDVWIHNGKSLRAVVTLLPLPEHVRRHLEDAQQAFIFECYGASIAMAAATLEYALNDRGVAAEVAKDGDLNEKRAAMIVARKRLADSGIPSELFAKIYIFRNLVVHNDPDRPPKATLRTRAKVALVRLSALLAMLYDPADPVHQSKP